MDIVSSLKRCAMMCALFLVSLCVQAGATCYQWAASASVVNGGYSSSAAAAVGALITACMASNTSKGSCEAAAAANPCPASAANAGSCLIDSFVAVASLSGTFPSYSVAGTMGGHYIPSNATFSYAWTPSLSSRTNPEGCPACSAAGTYRTLAFSSSQTVGANACGADGCEYTVSSPSTWMAVRGNVNPYITGSKSTGAACGSDSTVNISTGNDTSDTQQSSNGKTTATMDPASQCGTVNGDLVCPTAMTAGQCTSYSSGAVACVATSSGASMSAPPAPNDGSNSSTAALPDVTIQVGNVTTYYYNSSTVNNSTTAPTTTSSGTNTAGVTHGSSSSGSASSGSSGSASGGDDCTAPPVCSGDQIQCAILRQDWNMRCNVPVSSSDALAAIGAQDSVSSQEVDLSSALDETRYGVGGSCPADPTFSFAGVSHTLPFSQWLCPFMIMMAPFVMGCAYLVSAGVLVGSL